MKRVLKITIAIFSVLFIMNATGVGQTSFANYIKEVITHNFYDLAGSMVSPIKVADKIFVRETFETNSQFITGTLQTTIAAQDFETSPGTPTLTYTTTTGTFASSSGNSGTGDRPASSSFSTSGTTAWAISNSTVANTFANVNLAGYTDVQIRFRLAAFSIGSTGNGMEATDSVIAAVSTDGGMTYNNQVTVTGSSANNAYWHYSTGTGIASTTLGTAATFAPAGGANRTTDGYSTAVINVPNGTSQVRLRITATNNAAAERWTVDDVQVTGTFGGGPTQPDLTISQNAPGSVANGSPLTYTLNVINNGTAITGTPFDASFELPAAGYINPMVISTGCFTGSSIVSTTVTFTGCSTLGQGASSTMTVQVTPNSDGTLMSGTATVDSGNAIAESNEGNNTAVGISTNVFSPSPVVINEVYGGGGNSGAPLDADFIELYNNGSTPFNLNGYSLQYAPSPFGGYNTVIILPNVSIPANDYFLVQTTNSATPGFTPNFATSSPNLSASSGNVILVNGTTALGNSCPSLSDITVIDRIAYGAGTCSEGASFAAGGSNTTSVARTTVGVDTNSNSTDFSAGGPTPTAGTLPIPSISINDVSLAEGNAGTTDFSFTVSLSSAAPAGGVTFNIATADNTATTADNDYATNSLSGQTIPAGTSAYTFTVLVNGDTAFEPNEAFFVNLTNINGATIGDGQGQGNIQNDDVAPNPTVQLSVSSNTGSEDNATVITVTATSSSAVSGNQTVDLTVTGTGITAGDYTLNPTPITISDGSTTGTATFTVVDDSLVEGTETATITLSNPSAGITLGMITSQNIMITDNDVTPNLTINDVSQSEGNSGTTTFSFTVNLSSPAGAGGITFDIAAADNTATTADNDYSVNTLTGQTIPSGSSSYQFNVIVNGDNAIEPDETFFVNVTNVTGANVTDGQGQGTITNDDFDTISPIITYTPLPNTSSTINPTLSVTITDNIGVNSGSLSPRIYYKRNSDMYSSNGCIFNSGTPQNGIWDCIVDYSTIGAGNGDAITYFVIAQDTSGNISSNPSGVSATDVNTVTSPPSAPNLYTIGNAVIPGGSYTNLNLSGGTSLGGNVTVTDVLTLGGIVTTGGNTLLIGCTGSVSGAGTGNYVVGSVRKDFCGPANFDYPVGTIGGENPGYSPVFVSPVINFAPEGTPFLTVAAEDSVLPELSSTDFVSRNWDLNGSGLTVNIVFTYLPGDANGNSANYKVVRRVGTTNQTVCSSGCISGNTATATNVSSFSKWGIGDLAPTAASVDVGGRVLNRNGRGISKARIIMTDAQGNTRMALTNPFGYYRFMNVSAGETYTFAASHKLFNLSNSQIRFILEDDFGIDFIANEESENLKSDKDVKDNLYPMN